MELDVQDEALINAPAPAVYRALVDQAMGTAPWWLPDLETRPRPGARVDQVGGLTDITVHRPGRPRFTARTVEVVPDRLLRMQYVAGDIRGQGTWLLEPEGDRTRLSFRWQVRPKRVLFRLLAPFVDFGGVHSQVMRIGFVRLERYLAEHAKTLGAAGGSTSSA